MKILCVGICLLAALAMVQATSTSCTMDNCGDCIDYLPECSLCPDKHAMNDAKTKCIKCPDFCLNCNVTANGKDTTCVTCMTGYYTDAGDCSACTTNCDTCGNAQACTVCSDGYFLATGNVCSSCSTNCKSCSSNSACSTCKTGYYLNAAGTCTSCPNWATSCSLSGTSVLVTACATPRLVSTDQTQCLSCPTSCAVCSQEPFSGTVAKCTTCKSGYFLSSDECSACPSHCSSCSDDVTCDVCNAGYTDKNEALHTCQACKSGCGVCEVDASGVESCSVCVPGKILDGGVCKTCLAGCATCADITSCATCNKGYGLSTAVASGPNVCLLNATNCKVMKAAGDAATAKCTTCEDGYGITTDLQCAKCSTSVANCLNCTGGATTADTVVCTKCASGFGKAACTACTLADCGDCMTDNTKCVACKVGRVINTATDDCSQTCPSRCVCTYTAAPVVRRKRQVLVGTCASCNAGYYQPAGENRCTSCGSNCLTCADATTCVCKPGYGLDTSGNCQTCGDGCVECAADVTTCTSCQARTILDAGVCQPCPDNCLNCDYTSTGSSCTACDPNYAVTAAGQCFHCPGHCTKCSLTTIGTDSVYVCDECESTFGLNKFVCSDCPSGCEVCDYQTNEGVICSQCKTGFGLTSDGCKACPTACIACDSSLQCTDCAIGHGLSYTKACIACSTFTFDNCAVCSDNPGYQNDTAQCEACATGYFLQNSRKNGTNAKCLAESAQTDLDCASAPVQDLPPMCKPTKCNPGFTLSDSGVCIKYCFRCGDIRINSYIPMDQCINTNSTGVMFDECASGVCFGKKKEQGGVTLIVGGCLPTSEGNECGTSYTGCTDTDDGEICKKCCSQNLCNGWTESEFPSSSAPNLASVTALIMPILMALLY